MRGVPQPDRQGRAGRARQQLYRPRLHHGRPRRAGQPGRHVLHELAAAAAVRVRGLPLPRVCGAWLRPRDGGAAGAVCGAAAGRARRGVHGGAHARLWLEGPRGVRAARRERGAGGVAGRAAAGGVGGVPRGRLGGGGGARRRAQIELSTVSTVKPRHWSMTQ